MRGAWIEIKSIVDDFAKRGLSLPVRGAWIEIRLANLSDMLTESLPVRGAWIEIDDEGIDFADV